MAFEYRQDIHEWQRKLKSIFDELETLVQSTEDEPNISVAEHNDLCKSITHLENFMEAFNELENRKGIYINNDNE